MTVFVYRNGKLVDKRRALLFEQAEKLCRETTQDLQIDLIETLCKPFVSRFVGYESPIDDRWISSDRQRERDLAANNAYDPRDLGADHVYKRGIKETADANRERREARGTDTWGKFPNDPTGAAKDPA